MARGWFAAALLCSSVLVAACGDDSSSDPPAAPAVALDCAGSGSPTVVFESGLGVDSRSTWSDVQRLVSARTRACFRDRPGTGSAPARPGPRTSEVMVRELRDALGGDQAEPVVLVGASFGGLNVQLFAATYPSEVAGLVFVDSLTPGWDAAFEKVLGPDEARRRAEQIGQNPEGVSFEDQAESARQVSAAGPLPPVPHAVLVHSDSFDPGGDPIPELERAWRAEQARLARRFPEGRIEVVPGSTHRIAEDQPQAIADAILQILGTSK